jgi:NAD-dependent dihydropyrimidine dehydrogenase PreA subunit
MIPNRKKRERIPLFPKPQIERVLEIVTIPELCKGTSCKICLAYCENDVLNLTTEEFNSTGNYFVKVAADEKCDECLNCYRHCPEFAIFLKSRTSEENKSTESVNEKE